MFFNFDDNLINQNTSKFSWVKNFVYNFLYNILIACMGTPLFVEYDPDGICLDLIRASCIREKFHTTYSFCWEKIRI